MQINYERFILISVVYVEVGGKNKNSISNLYHRIHSLSLMDNSRQNDHQNDTVRWTWTATPLYVHPISGRF